MTPASRIAISTSRRPAAANSTVAVSARSAPTIRRMVGLADEVCMARVDPALCAVPSSSTEIIVTASASASGELADRALEQRPGVVAEALLPFGVEAGLAELGAEGIGRWLVEDHALRLQVGLQRRVELLDVLTLLHAGVVDRVRQDLLQVRRQLAPGTAVGDEPEAVPDVIGERAVFLHLVELRHLQDRQRIFLRVDDLGLQRGINRSELQADRRGAER